MSVRPIPIETIILGPIKRPSENSNILLTTASREKLCIIGSIGRKPKKETIWSSAGDGFNKRRFAIPYPYVREMVMCSCYGLPTVLIRKWDSFQCSICHPFLYLFEIIIYWKISITILCRELKVFLEISSCSFEIYLHFFIWFFIIFSYKEHSQIEALRFCRNRAQNAPH